MLTTSVNIFLGSQKHKIKYSVIGFPTPAMKVEFDLMLYTLPHTTIEVIT